MEPVRECSRGRHDPTVIPVGYMQCRHAPTHIYGHTREQTHTRTLETSHRNHYCSYNMRTKGDRDSNLGPPTDFALEERRIIKVCIARHIGGNVNHSRY